MYIGPDSVCLSRNVANLPFLRGSEVVDVLDVCSGSGIQGISVANALGSGAGVRVTFVDVSPRALQFTKMNCMLNDLSSSATSFVEASVYNGVKQQYNLIVANPPYVPTPPKLRSRNGLYVDGGARGDDILREVIGGGKKRLKEGGWLCCVTEVCNGEEVLERMNTELAGLGGFLFLNNVSVGVDEYARRRAKGGGEHEAQIWSDHLKSEGVNELRVAVFFLRGGGGVETVVVPKLFSPRSVEASSIIQQKMIEFLL